MDRYAITYLEHRDLWVLHHATYEKVEGTNRWVPVSSEVIGTYTTEEAASGGVSPAVSPGTARRCRTAVDPAPARRSPAPSPTPGSSPH